MGLFGRIIESGTRNSVQSRELKIFAVTRLQIKNQGLTRRDAPISAALDDSVTHHHHHHCHTLYPALTWAKG